MDSNALYELTLSDIIYWHFIYEMASLFLRKLTNDCVFWDIVFNVLSNRNEGYFEFIFPKQRCMVAVRRVESNRRLKINKTIELSVPILI